MDAVVIERNARMDPDGRVWHGHGNDVDVAEAAAAHLQPGIHAKAGEGAMRRRLVEETGRDCIHTTRSDFWIS